MKCGINNCKKKSGQEWDTSDDCCYKGIPHFIQLLNKLGKSLLNIHSHQLPQCDQGSAILNISGPEYKTYLNQEKKTCSNHFFIDKGSWMDQSQCRIQCDIRKECMFFFFTANNWCGLYESCDQFRKTRAIGTTFEKQVKGIFFSLPYIRTWQIY